MIDRMPTIDLDRPNGAGADDDGRVVVDPPASVVGCELPGGLDDAGFDVEVDDDDELDAGFDVDVDEDDELDAGFDVDVDEVVVDIVLDDRL